jgi:ferredoxin
MEHNSAACAAWRMTMNRMERKIIEIDEELCNGCGQCILSCAEGALEIVDGKARVIADRYCDGLGACLGECPTGALRIIEREADPFDEEAVEELLEQRKEARPRPSSCPSAQLWTQEQKMTPCQRANQPMTGGGATLMNWPVQIGLVPPHAPFLKGADLLVTADCAPAACPTFHSEFLPGRVVLMGCPKFDDQQSYLDKFVQILRQNEIRSVTVLVMEVPCCQSLPRLVERAAKTAGTGVEVRTVVVGRNGRIMEEAMGAPDPKLKQMMHNREKRL